MSEEPPKSKRKMNAGTSTTPELSLLYSLSGTVRNKECQYSACTSEAGTSAGRFNEYMRKLQKEKETLETKFLLIGAESISEFPIIRKLIDIELERIQNGGKPLIYGGNRPAVQERKFADVIKEKPIKVTIRVLVPIREHPKFNFVGKLLGPKGNSLKRLQEETMTKMAILGRGSMRDKHKEEELRASSDPKYSHFNDDLHVEITAFAPPAEAHARIAFALAEVRKFLVPDYNDEIRQEQMREMQLMNTSSLLSFAQLQDAPAANPSELGSPNVSPTPSTTTPFISPPAKVMCQQNGRAIHQQLAYAQNGHNNYLYSQQYLLHPALRGLAPRAHGLPVPGSTVFSAAGSILSRMRPLPNITATPVITSNRISPMALAKHHNNIISLIARGSTSVFAGATSEENTVEAPLTPSDSLLLCPNKNMKNKDEITAAASTSSAAVYGMYENFSKATVSANTAGYGLLDPFSSRNSFLTSDALCNVTASQESASHTGPPEMSAVSEVGAVKHDRARYRHDPYPRFTAAAVKLPL